MKNKVVVGLWPISGDFGRKSLCDIEQIISKSIDNGLRSFDVAPNYGNGFAEMALGMVASNEDIDIYTKCGNHPFVGKNFSKSAILSSVECSLKRLKVDKVKGLFLHNPRNEVLDYDELFNFLDDLKKQGVVELTGISGAKGYEYAELNGLEIDLYQQDANLLYLKELKSNNVKSKYFFARSPLGTGILSGSLHRGTVFAEDDHRSCWLKGDRLLSLLRRVKAIENVIGEASLQSVAKRFLLSNSKVDYMVTGVSKPSHVNSLVDDLKLGQLEDEMLVKLHALYDDNFGLDGVDLKLGY